MTSGMRTVVTSGHQEERQSNKQLCYPAELTSRVEDNVTINYISSKREEKTEWAAMLGNKCQNVQKKCKQMTRVFSAIN